MPMPMMRPLLLALCLVPAACTKSKETPNGPADDGKAAEEKDEPLVRTSASPPQEPAADDGAAAPPVAVAQIGEPAPSFALKDVQGHEHTLSEHAGKIVVLEWFNPNCPFVEHAHSQGPLKEMAAAETSKGVVWLSINSGAPGKQGYGVQANALGIEKYGMTNPVLLDEDGTVGHAYGAEKTPHMFVIDPEGTLVYRGAIDNAPIGEVDGGGEEINYVLAALQDLRSGNPVRTPQTAPYGCTVKYDKG